MNVLRQLSAYVDGELSGDLCRELRRHLGDCPNCEVFLDSLRQTVSLCRNSKPRPLSAAAKARLRRDIFKAAAL